MSHRLLIALRRKLESAEQGGHKARAERLRARIEALDPTPEPEAAGVPEPVEFDVLEEEEETPDTYTPVIVFASPQAEALAAENGLGTSDFAGYEPSGVSGYTTSDVRRIVGE